MHQQRCGDEEAEPGKEASIALYWDFENLHASLAEARQEGAYSKQDNRFKVQEPLIDIRPWSGWPHRSGRSPSTGRIATGSISAVTAMPCCKTRLS